MVALDWKCAIGTAVATVLIYIVLVYVLGAENRPWKYTTESEKWTSMEVLMLASVFLAFNLNINVMGDCRAH